MVSRTIQFAVPSLAVADAVYGLNSSSWVATGKMAFGRVPLASFTSDYGLMDYFSTYTPDTELASTESFACVYSSETEMLSEFVRNLAGKIGMPSTVDPAAGLVSVTTELEATDGYDCLLLTLLAGPSDGDKTFTMRFAFVVPADGDMPFCVMKSDSDSAREVVYYNTSTAEVSKTTAGDQPEFAGWWTGGDTVAAGSETGDDTEETGSGTGTSTDSGTSTSGDAGSASAGTSSSTTCNCKCSSGIYLVAALVGLVAGLKCLLESKPAE